MRRKSPWLCFPDATRRFSTSRVPRGSEERRGEAIDRVRIDRFNLSCLRGANGFTWKHEFGPFDALVKTLFPTWWACWLSLSVGTLQRKFPLLWYFVFVPYSLVFFHGKINELIRSVWTINLNWSNIYIDLKILLIFIRMMKSTNRFFSKTLNILIFNLTMIPCIINRASLPRKRTVFLHR